MYATFFVMLEDNLYDQLKLAGSVDPRCYWSYRVSVDRDSSFFNPVMPVASKHGQTIWVIILTKAYFGKKYSKEKEKLNLSYNCLHTFQIHLSFLSYFQNYHRSRCQFHNEYYDDTGLDAKGEPMAPGQ